jgi:hypothetical protein
MAIFQQLSDGTVHKWHILQEVPRSAGCAGDELGRSWTARGRVYRECPTEVRAQERKFSGAAGRLYRAFLIFPVERVV